MKASGLDNYKKKLEKLMEMSVSHDNYVKPPCPEAAWVSPRPLQQSSQLEENVKDFSAVVTILSIISKP